MQSRIHQDFGKFGIFGTSMGAAIALQTAAIDHRLSAVVSEGSFTNLRTIFVDYQKRIIKLPWHFLRNVALVHSQRIANFKARLVSPLEDVRKIRVPILFVHGENDSFIKKKYAHALFEAARDPKELLIVPGANHSNVWDVGGSAYHEALAEFFKKHLTQ
jgi:hypothetical protein